jgi:hypothetical protein
MAKAGTIAAVDNAAVSLIDSRIKDVRDQFEKRLIEDREFIKSVLGLAVKICGVSLVLIFGIIGFFGYKDIASIDDKINKSVSEKIKEKSDEFKLIYEKNIQGLADQASVTAYLLQFAAPQKSFERPTILATHLQRFIQILSEESSDSKITDAIYDLLSNPARDERSALVIIGSESLYPPRAISLGSRKHLLDWRGPLTYFVTVIFMINRPQF